MAPPDAIIDTHIHLFSASHLPHLAWNSSSHPLNSAYPLESYLSSASCAQLKGFVFIETDRKYTLPAPDATASEFISALKWTLEEFTYVSALSQRSEKVLGIVPWAPLPLGEKGLDIWWECLDGDKDLLKGVRFLIQDKPKGTLTARPVVEGLKWVRRKRLVFDLGIDVRSAGIWQLEEAVEAFGEVMRDVPEGGGVVLNHLVKPDMHIPPEQLPSHPTFVAWQKHLRLLAAHADFSIKMSGVFSELPASIATAHAPDALGLPAGTADAIVAHAKPWLRAAFDIFGAHRVLWGSDWPVANVGFWALAGKRNQNGAWKAWRGVSERLLDELVREGVLRTEDLPKVWAENAQRVYGLNRKRVMDLVDEQAVGHRPCSSV